MWRLAPRRRWRVTIVVEPFIDTDRHTSVVIVRARSRAGAIAVALRSAVAPITTVWRNATIEVIPET